MSDEENKVVGEEETTDAIEEVEESDGDDALAETEEVPAE